MEITCKSKSRNNNNNGQKLQAGQQVNRIGRYLYKHIDGAFKFQTSSNMFDVWFFILYQIPYLQRIPGKGKEYNSMHEMTININITTYQNKVRVNIIECDPKERTLGFKAWKPEELENLQVAQELILEEVQKKVCKAYQDYDFVF